MSLAITFGHLRQSFLENTLTVLLLVSFSHGTLAENTYYGTGAGAGTNDVGADNNVAFGENALGRGLTSTADNNTAIGSNALYSNTSGYLNSAVGYRALYSNTGGFHNSAFGYAAMENNTTGDYNTASGNYALRNNTTGWSNNASGYSALSANTTGAWNNATGLAALTYNTTGNRNNATGQGALYHNTTGSNNNASGHQALWYNTTGDGNSALGYYALRNNTTGSNNLGLGYQSGHLNQTGSKNVFIGYQAGYNETGSDKLYIDNSSTSTPLIYGDFANDALTVNGTLAATGSITTSGALSSGSIVNSGTLTSGSIATSGALSSGSIVNSGTLTSGSIATSGALSSGSIVNSGTLSSGSITTSGALSSGSIVNSGTLSSGSITTSGALSSGSIVNSGTLSSGSITTSGALSSGSIVNSGTLSSGSIVNSGMLTSGSITTSGTLTALGNIATEGTLTAKGNITAPAIYHTNGTKMLSIENGSVHLGPTSMIFTDSSISSNADIMHSSVGKIQLGKNATDATTVVGTLSVQDPTEASHAANKAYVDSVRAGMSAKEVRKYDSRSVALSAALTALPTTGGTGSHTCGIGAGVRGDYSAMALGCAADLENFELPAATPNFIKNASVNAGTSFLAHDDPDYTFKVGMSFNFGGSQSKRHASNSEADFHRQLALLAQRSQQIANKQAEKINKVSNDNRGMKRINLRVLAENKMIKNTNVGLQSQIDGLKLDQEELLTLRSEINILKVNKVEMLALKEQLTQLTALLAGSPLLAAE